MGTRLVLQEHFNTMWPWPIVAFVCGVLASMFFFVIGSWAYFDNDKRVVMFAEGLIGIVAYFGLWASRDFGDEGERNLSFIAGLSGMAVGALLHFSADDAWWLYH